MELSYSEIARRSGYTRQHVANVLRGKSKPSLSAATKIAEAMGLTVEELYGRIQGP